MTDRQKNLLSGCELARARKAVWPVLDAYGIAWGNVIASDRRPFMVRVRWEVCEALRNAGMSLPLIGRIIKRNHTTVLHGLRALEIRREYDQRRVERTRKNPR
jgi:chromosomal replication initiation ATPase DnaA